MSQEPTGTSQSPPAAPQQTTESLGIEQVDEGQNTTILAQVAKDVRMILTPNETIAYIAHQNRTAFGQRRDAAVATNNRIIIYRPHRFGRLEFHDFLWEDVRDVTIAEKVWSSQFTCVTTDDRTLQLGGLVKEQARTLYAFCQQKEQEWRERRRVRQMEEERARAGGPFWAGKLRRLRAPGPSPSPSDREGVPEGAVRCSFGSRNPGSSEGHVSKRKAILGILQYKELTTGDSVQVFSHSWAICGRVCPIKPETFAYLSVVVES